MARGAFLLLLAMLLPALGACTSTRTITQTPRSAMEQTLLAGAVQRAAVHLEGPEMQEAGVYLEVSGLTLDAHFAKETLAAELQTRGAIIVSDVAQAQYLVKVLVQTLGTDKAETFVGIPRLDGFLFPIPEITFFRWLRQTGVSRLHVTVLDARTGRMIGDAEKIATETVFSRMTIFLITLESADVHAPAAPPPAAAGSDAAS